MQLNSIQQMRDSSHAVAGVFKRNPPHHAMDRIAFVKQKFRQVRSDLPRDSGNQSVLHRCSLPARLRSGRFHYSSPWLFTAVLHGAILQERDMLTSSRMRQGLVSILVPLFNEEEFIGETLRRVVAAVPP